MIIGSLLGALVVVAALMLPPFATALLAGLAVAGVVLLGHSYRRQHRQARTAGDDGVQRRGHEVDAFLRRQAADHAQQGLVTRRQAEAGRSCTSCSRAAERPRSVMNVIPICSSRARCA